MLKWALFLNFYGVCDLGLLGLHEVRSYLLEGLQASKIDQKNP